MTYDRAEERNYGARHKSPIKPLILLRLSSYLREAELFCLPRLNFCALVQPRFLAKKLLVEGRAFLLEQELVRKSQSLFRALQQQYGNGALALTKWS
jgi:hypothetical protein